MAAAWLQEHDDLVAAGQRPHRVTQFFCGHQDKSLRAEMQSHAAGRGMSDRLRCEIRAYQLCKVDDTWAEAAHRDITGCRGRKTGAKVAYVAATQRLRQTLAWVDTMTQTQLDTFHTCMRRWKAIGQFAPSRQKSMVPVHRKPSSIFAQVHRYDSAAVRDWGMELDSAIKWLSDRPGHRLQMAQRLQVEWLLSAIADGDALSIPETTDSTLQQARATALADLPALFGRQPDEANAFFIVVDSHAGRKKTWTTSGQRLRGMCHPVAIQDLTWWPAGSEQGEITLYFHGAPRVVDLLSLAPWPALRCGVRRWQVGAAAARGCVALREPALVAPRLELMDQDTPAIVLLERLAIAGWTRGNPPLEHTLATPKQFWVKDPMTRKSYMQCLLRLPELVGEGRQLDTLRSDQSRMYYSCVLANKEGHLVPIGQTAKCYAALMAICDQAPEQGQDDASVGSAKSGGSSDELMVVAPSPDRRGQRGRGRGRGGRRAGRSAAAEPDWGALVLATPPAPPPIERPEAIGDAASAMAEHALVPAPPGATAGSGEVIRPETISSRAPVPVPQPREGVARRTRNWDMQFLEGVVVTRDIHLSPDQPGHYDRLVVKCARHQVIKTRAFDVKAAAKLGLGDAEPYAYLGAWLRHCEFCPSAAAHKGFVPTAEQVRSYVASQRWQLPATQ